MADFKTHVTTSCVLGVGVAAGAYSAGFTGVQAVLSGCLTGFAGMLPDLDSDTGRPIKEIFGATAAFAPMLLMRRLVVWGGDWESAVLLAVLVYIGIRYGLSTILALVTVHRGMFHSIPAMLISAECAFLCYQSNDLRVKGLMAGSVALGFLSHLILDEIYSVAWNGVAIRLKKSAGSATKVFGPSAVPNAICFSLLFLLGYAVMMQGEPLLANLQKEQQQSQESLEEDLPESTASQFEVIRH